MFGKALFIVCFGTVLAVLLTSIQLCTSAHAEEPEPECWAVMVGVSHYASSVCYEDEEGNLVCDGDLKYADDDARGLYELLASIWGEDHVELLLDSEATKVDIYYAIKRLAAKADNDDTVLIYFTGHGLRQDYPAYIDYAIGSDYEMATIWQISNTMIWQDRQIVGPGYFCPFDSGNPLSSSHYYYDPDYGWGWYLDCDYEISAAHLARWLDMVDSEKVVVILDSCQSGSLSTELSQDGRVILMACQPDEGSLESCELEHGVFTHYLLQALSDFDAADTNCDYELSAQEVFSYAELRTIDETVTCGNVTAPTDEITTGALSVCDNVTVATDGTIVCHNVTISEGDIQHPVISGRHLGELSLLMKVVFHAGADFPPDTAALTVDGKPYQSGELPASFIWAPGSVHALDIPSQMDTGEGTRLVFASWDDGDASVSRAISHGGEYTADYETQYQLTIESAWGNPVGQGWYESGEVAHVSVHSTAGIIIRRLFAGWSGDFVGTEESTLLTMDGPKIIIANWRADYLRLYLLIAGVVALVGATVGICVHRRRKSS